MDKQLNDKRDAHADCIINLAFNYNGYLFGGYLRDLFAGKTTQWNDIDLSFSKIVELEEFIKVLGCFFDVVEEKPKLKYANRALTVTSKIDSEIVISVDVNYTICGDLGHADFDVNGFIQSANRAIKHRYGGVNVRQLIALAQEKEFNIVANCNKQRSDAEDRKFKLCLANRICKMQANGWVCLNLKESVMNDWVLKNLFLTHPRGSVTQGYSCSVCQKSCTESYLCKDNTTGFFGHYDCLMLQVPFDKEPDTDSDSD